MTTTMTTALDLTFLEPLPGLPGHTRFALSAVAGAEGLYTLRALGAGDAGAGGTGAREPAGAQLPRLFLIDPSTYFPDYRPGVHPATLERLGSQHPEVLVVLHPALGNEPHSANLLAPVLLNASVGTAVQVVLDDSAWPLRAPLLATAS